MTPVSTKCLKRKPRWLGTGYLVVFVSMAATCVGHGQTAPSRSGSEQSMHQHYDSAFRLQAAGHLAEADVEHKLFLGEALHHVANDRANIGEYALAVPVYEEAIQFAPKDFTLHVEFAEATLDADDPTKAKRLAKESLALLPETATQERAQATYVLARALWGTGERKQSIDDYKTAAALDPSFTNVYAVGTTYLTLSDKANAAKVFAEIVVKFGDTAAIRMQLGRAYALATEYPEAIQEFKKALAEDDRMPGLHYSLGAAMMSASAASYPMAEAEFRKELAIEPDDKFSYPQLGRIALARHSYKEAESDLVRANELDPGNPDTYLLMAQLYTEMGSAAEAEAALREAIAATTDPSRHHYQIANAHYQLGRLLLQRNDKDEAKQQMQIAEDLKGQSRLQDESSLNGQPMVQSPLQMTHVPTPAEVSQEKRFESEIGPAIASSYDNLAVHEAIGKNYGVAATYFRYTVEWNPALTGADRNWGQAAFEAQRFEEAIGPLSRSLQAHPEDEASRAMLGISQHELHDYPAALATLQYFGDHVDKFPGLPLAYADSMVKAGDFKQGMQMLEAAARNDPQNAAAHRALAEAYRTDHELQDAQHEEQLANTLQSQHAGSTRGATAGESPKTKN